MLEWMIMPLRRYADFKGRSRRKEFWLFALLNMVVILLIVIAMFATNGELVAQLVAAQGKMLATYAAMFSGVGLLLAIWSVLMFVPNAAVSVRRLHDRNLSGWWYAGVLVCNFAPYVRALSSIGGLVFLVIMCLEGTRGPNRFGPDPKGPAHQDVFA
ncbi:MAG: DUF805 domain-containing protein [Novosphingobium sp.]|nr:DUF805 domain-containing protein [Novosphingobium sp.]